MHIYESAENYLETILILQNRAGQVRSIDIANELSFSKPSVSVAMKNLRNGGYIEMNKDGLITLTDSGREIAERIFTAFSAFAIAVGGNPRAARWRGSMFARGS